MTGQRTAGARTAGARTAGGRMTGQPMDGAGGVRLWLPPGPFFAVAVPLTA
jgi:hypothetical protein